MIQPAERLVGPDVTRGVALIGVVIMNYHGYLNGCSAVAGPTSSRAQSMFDPWTGVLSTRFAATFVLVAGIGISLMTASGTAGGDAQRILADRWRLVRRGFLLYAGGFVLNWIWSGTILFFYGAFFVVGSLLFTLRSRTIVAVGTLSMLAAAGLQWWIALRTRDGDSTAWLTAPDTLGTRSPRGLVFDTFVNGTHPLLPWLCFLCAGIVLGRHVRTLRRQVIVPAALSMTALAYLANHLATRHLSANDPDDVVWNTVLSTRPFDRGILYTLGTMGIAVAAYCLISWLAERFAGGAPVFALAATGRTTLTLYVLHALVFNGFVNWWHWVGPTGLDTALLFAIGFWIVAIALAAWWQRFIGIGPLERLYRSFGG